MLERYSRRRVGYYSNGLLKYCNDRSYTRMDTRTAVALIVSASKIIGIFIASLFKINLGGTTNSRFRLPK